MASFTPETFWTAAQQAFSSQTLSLTILPTERCNLRCVYCYETFELGKMSNTVVCAVKALVQTRISELTSLNIDWFGGEPLLALDVMEDIGSFAAGRCQNQGTSYRSAVTTNGVLLTRPIAERLISIGTKSFHVSLDGDAESHNRTRVTRRGEGTYDAIIDNLTQLKGSSLPFDLTIRLHVTAENLASLGQFVVELRDRFLSDHRFSAYLFPIADLGGPNRGGFRVPSSGEANQFVRRFSPLLKKDRSSSHDVAASPVAASPYVCYAAKPNSWVIRSNGRLSKCTVALSDPRNDVGSLRPDGSLEIDSLRLKAWLQGWSTGSETALSCPLDIVLSDLGPSTDPRAVL